MRSPVLLAGLAILVTGLAVLLLFGDGPSVAGLAPDDFASLVSLSAIALLVGAGLFAFRRPVSPRLWHVAAWLAVLVGLMAAYELWPR